MRANNTLFAHTQYEDLTKNNINSDAQIYTFKVDWWSFFLCWYMYPFEIKVLTLVTSYLNSRTLKIRTLICWEDIAMWRLWYIFQNQTEDLHTQSKTRLNMTTWLCILKSKRGPSHIPKSTFECKDLTVCLETKKRTFRHIWENIWMWGRMHLENKNVDLHTYFRTNINVRT